MSSNTDLIFYVNGKKIEEPAPDPQCNLLSYLRDKLHLTGTKEGCSEGGCGACTVMISTYDRKSQKIRHEAVVSCLVSLCSLHGKAVTTVEGVGSIDTKLHPVQERLAKSHGAQCGFCSPGMVMSMYTLLRNNPHPKRSDIQIAIKGNLCRCTGYRPILDGFNTFAKDSECPMGENCCKNKAKEGEISRQKLPSLVESDKFTTYDPTQETIFPSELQIDDKYQTKSMKFSNGIRNWYRPTSLKETMDLLKEFPLARLVAGHTDVGFGFKKNEQVTVTCYIDITNVQELNETTVTKDGLVVGGAVKLSALATILENEVLRIGQVEGRNFMVVAEALGYLGSLQIRNMATIGGHLAVGPIISDIIPVLAACGSTITFFIENQPEKEMNMLEFYNDGNGYKTIEKGLITRIFIPKAKKKKVPTATLR